MLHLKHPSGIVKEVPTGFSWTTFFFGFFVPLIRGTYGYAAVCFVAALFTFSISNIVFAFIINKQFTQSLLEKGYEPCSEHDVLMLQTLGIMCSPKVNIATKAA